MWLKLTRLVVEIVTIEVAALVVMPDDQLESFQALHHA